MISSWNPAKTEVDGTSKSSGSPGPWLTWAFLLTGALLKVNGGPFTEFVTMLLLFYVLFLAVTQVASQLSGQGLNTHALHALESQVSVQPGMSPPGPL